MIEVSSTVSRSRVNGPGERFVIWMQGCSLRCKGCWNEHTWSKKSTTSKGYSVEELWSKIKADIDNIEGVTLTGGEPLEQAVALLPLVEKIQSNGLSLVIFTGYTLKELDDTQQKLLSYVDIVISGRYVEQLKIVDGGMRTSKNQEILYQTTRYKPKEETNSMEFWISQNGNIQVTGFPLNMGITP